MSELNKLKKLLNNQNLAVPNFYFCENCTSNKGNQEPNINSKILIINEEKFNKIINKNISKNKLKKTNKKKIEKFNKKTKKKNK